MTHARVVSDIVKEDPQDRMKHIPIFHDGVDRRRRENTETCSCGLPSRVDLIDQSPPSSTQSSYALIIQRPELLQGGRSSLVNVSNRSFPKWY